MNLIHFYDFDACKTVCGIDDVDLPAGDTLGDEDGENVTCDACKAAWMGIARKVTWGTMLFPRSWMSDIISEALAENWLREGNLVGAEVWVDGEMWTVYLSISDGIILGDPTDEDRIIEDADPADFWPATPYVTKADVDEIEAAGPYRWVHAWAFDTYDTAPNDERHELRRNDETGKWELRKIDYRYRGDLDRTFGSFAEAKKFMMGN
jgi:hypothetical protein